MVERSESPIQRSRSPEVSPSDRRRQYSWWALAWVLLMALALVWLIVYLI